MGLVMHNEPDDWQPIEKAPRDGTLIEIRNTYGVAPWYGLYRWTDECLARGPDGWVPFKGGLAWVSADGKNSVSNEAHLTWRAFRGDPSDYVDPTHGFQNDPRYWRQAVAEKLELPPDYFEAEIAAPHSNRQAAESESVRFSGWLKRLFRRLRL